MLLRNLRGCLPFLILSLGFFLVSCTDVEKEYYPDGTLKSKVSYQGDQMHGPAVWYFVNGNKELECTYVDGEPDGKLTRWYYNGQLNREDSYSKGKKNGPCIQWDEAGFKSILQTYRNDTLNGPYIEWHPNGEIMLEGRFRNGLYDSIWSYYDNRGIPVGKGTFNAGTGNLSGYYLNGKTSRVVSYKNNLKHGTERWFNEAGEVIREVVFSNGRIVRVVQGDSTASSIPGSKAPSQFLTL